MVTIKINSVTDQDTLDSTNVKFTPEGFMNVNAILARTGIQSYSTDEDILKPLLSELPAHLRNPGKIVRMLRPDTEVFSTDSLASIAFKPVTNNHPPNNISAKDAKNYIIGIAKEAMQESDYVKGELTIYDQKTIDDIKGGKKQISLGYSSDWEMKEGIDSKFGPYDGIMKNIRANHIAIVANGRAGNNVKILDKKGSLKMAERSIGNVKLEIADDKVGVIDALVLDAEKAKKDLVDATAANVELQKKIDALTGEKDALNAKIKDSIANDKLDSAVKERIKLIENSLRLHPKLVTDEMNNLDIKKEIVLERTKIDCKDKSIDYVNAAYDALVATTVSDSKELAKSLEKPAATSFETARQKFIDANKAAFEAVKKGKE
jgi:hypothetical protein